MASMEEFDAMPVQMLTDFLAVRGLSASGKKKAELVALAYSCVVLKIEIQATQVVLARDLKNDYDACLLKSGLTIDPNGIPTEDKVDTFPSILTQTTAFVRSDVFFLLMWQSLKKTWGKDYSQ